jgi:hypothetical protein
MVPRRPSFCVTDPADCRFDDLALFDGPPGRRAGAVFVLHERPPTAAVWERSDGWVVRIDPGSRGVVACGGSADDATIAWRSAYAAVQEALDVWSVKGVADLQTDAPYGNHIAFWESAAGARVRITDRATATASARVTGFAAGPTGNVTSAPPAPTIWHQSMRFFRQSQLAEDLFDALRSLWLALENLLDSIEPYDMRRDREGVWLRRALKSAFALLGQTGSQASMGGAAGTSKAPHDAAYEYYYDDLRTHLFHAKASREPTLPQDPAGVDALVERHQRLTLFYLDLLAVSTGVRRPGEGGLTIAGFERAVSWLDHGGEIAITDDSTPFDAAQTDVAPAGGTVVAVQAHRDHGSEQPMLRVYRGCVPGVDVSRLERVGRTLFVHHGHVAAGNAVAGDLRLRGIDVLEVQIELQILNAGPRRFPAA